MTRRPLYSRPLLRNAIADGLRARVRRGIDLCGFLCASVGVVFETFELVHHATLRTLIATIVMASLALCGFLGLIDRLAWTPTAFVGLVLVANVIYLISFGPWFGLGAVYILAIALALLFGSPRRARIVAALLVGTPLALGIAAHVGVIQLAVFDMSNAWSWGRATLATATALIGISLISHFTVRELVLGRRSLEALLERERAERLESERVSDDLTRARRSDAIAQLAAEVGADIGAALAIIETRARLLATELTTADARDSLGDIIEAATNAGSTMRQLTALAPAAVTEVERGDGIAAVRAVHKLVHRVLPPTITLAITTPDPAHEPVPVPIGTSDLTRICANLVLNSRDAIDAAGTITIALTRDATHAIIDVRDTGAGMDAATLGRLFQPFFTTKQVGRGTGLGLATTKILVERARGTIAVTTEVGAGTHFTIRLPLLPDGPPPGVERSRGTLANRD